MRQLYPVVPFEPSRNCLITLSNGRKSFLININAEGRISAAYSALLRQSGGLRRSLPSGRVRSSPLPWGERSTHEARRVRGKGLPRIRNPSPALAALGHPLPLGEGARAQRGRVRGYGFSGGPCPSPDALRASTSPPREEVKSVRGPTAGSGVTRRFAGEGRNTLR